MKVWTEGQNDEDLQDLTALHEGLLAGKTATINTDQERPAQGHSSIKLPAYEPLNKQRCSALIY